MIPASFVLTSARRESTVAGSSSVALAPAPLPALCERDKEETSGMVVVVVLGETGSALSALEHEGKGIPAWEVDMTGGVVKRVES